MLLPESRSLCQTWQKVSPDSSNTAIDETGTFQHGLVTQSPSRTSTHPPGIGKMESLRTLASVEHRGPDFRRWVFDLVRFAKTELPKKYNLLVYNPVWSENQPQSTPALKHNSPCKDPVKKRCVAKTILASAPKNVIGSRGACRRRLTQQCCRKHHFVHDGVPRAVLGAFLVAPSGNEGTIRACQRPTVTAFRMPHLQVLGNVDGLLEIRDTESNRTCTSRVTVLWLPFCPRPASARFRARSKNACSIDVFVFVRITPDICTHLVRSSSSASLAGLCPWPPLLTGARFANCCSNPPSMASSCDHV